MWEADNPEDRPAIERCLGVSLPCLGGLCPFSRIVQSQDYVTMYYEQGAAGGIFRNIPLDRRPHLPSSTRLWLGNSVGRWEGTTLVVDTTNFTSQTSFRGSRENLHLIERFDRVSAYQISYKVTVEDPTQFSRPWTLELIWAQTLRGVLGYGAHVLAVLSVLAVAASACKPHVAPPLGPESARFHHLHLNSTDPAAAIDFYARAFTTVTKTAWNGVEGVTTRSRLSTRPGNIHVLFGIAERVATPGPDSQSAIAHFGWNVPDARSYLERFRGLQLQLVPMYADAEGTVVTISSDGLPGYLTAKQIAEARIKGVIPTRTGGFLYVQGPDGALIESYGNFPAERFTHIHMYHRDPICAQQWYARHLGRRWPPRICTMGPAVPTRIRTIRS